MLTNICLSNLPTVGRCLRHQIRRNFGASAVLLQKSEDPIQQLFVEKIREYAKKKQAAGGQLVDATPELKKELNIEMERLKAQYRGAGQDMAKFPAFQFSDKELETAPTQSRKGEDPSILPF